MKEECYNCKYMIVDADNDSYCKRHAPIREINGAAAWPKVYPHADWCGDWKNWKEDEDE